MDNQPVTLPGDYRYILAAFDGSAGSARALRRGIEISVQHGARVVVLSVFETLPRHAPGVGEVEVDESVKDQYFSQLREKALEIVGGRESGILIESEVGHAAQTIVGRAIEGHFDLVVIGRSGHSGLWGALLGSTTSRVVDQAPCDVLVVR